MGGMDANEAKQRGTFDPGNTRPMDPPPEAGNGSNPRNGSVAGDGPRVFDLERAAPTLASIYGPAQLERDKDRELVSLARLPPWPAADHRPGHPGHGWGDDMNTLLGGGVHPGYMLALGATHAGAGKTAWIMQLADGLALRTAELVREGRPGPLTPVLVLSEMGATALTWRSLARWCDEDGRIFRAGKSAPNLALRSGRFSPEDVERAFANARLALEPGGALEQARRFARLLAPTAPGLAAVDAAAATINAWRDQLATAHGREVWPVLVIDPIQRWQDPTKGEVEALNELVEALGDRAHGDGWIVFATSDTNKAAAKGARDGNNTREDGTATFRGSYKLMHLVDAALTLEREDAEDPANQTVFATVIKNRWGDAAPNPNARAAYRWNASRARYEPPRREVEA